MTPETIHVVWWSLLLGGLIGGLCRSIVSGSGFAMPYVLRNNGRLILEPGFLGDFVIGPVAALLLLGASSSTYDFQSAYAAKGFWAPLVSSIVAGVGAIQLSQALVSRQLDTIQNSILERLEAKPPLTQMPPHATDEPLPEATHDSTPHVQKLIARLNSSNNPPERARILGRLQQHLKD